MHKQRQTFSRKVSSLEAAVGCKMQEALRWSINKSLSKGNSSAHSSHQWLSESMDAHLRSKPSIAGTLELVSHEDITEVTRQENGNAA